MRPGVGQRRASLDQGPAGTEKEDHLRGQKEEPGRWDQCSQKTQISDVALQSPNSVPLHSAFSLFNLGPSALVCVCRRCTQTRSLGAIQSLYSGSTEVWSVEGSGPRHFD